MMSSTFELMTTLNQLGLSTEKLVTSSVNELLQLPEEQLQQIQFYLISKNFRFHYENNLYYHELCKCQNVTPEDIQSFQDLVKIPLVPLSKFKSATSFELLSVPLNQIEHEMRSVGTGEIPSVSRRCSTTVDLGIIGTTMMFREYFGVCKGAALFLSPSPEEIPEMGLLKLLNLMSGLLDTHRYLVKNNSFDPATAFEQLKSWQMSFDRHIIGPPFLILMLLKYMRKNQLSLKLDKRSLIITMGGWKSFTGKLINRDEFYELCYSVLGVERKSIRDIYGLVEANVIAIEDQNGVKRVAPYCHFSVRHIDRLHEEVPEGKPGVLAVLDPLSKATPGFIITDDVVRLLPNLDPHRSGGQRMEYVAKAPTAKEFGCCAVNLEKNMNSNSHESQEVYV